LTVRQLSGRNVVIVERNVTHVATVLLAMCFVAGAPCTSRGFEEQVCRAPKGVRKWRGWVNPPTPMSSIFYKSLLPAPRRLIVFAYFLLVNLPTQCKYHGINLHITFKEYYKWVKK